ncbi:MAG: hypothetical protein A4E19_17665 [Nitrospira sp. SG-bin1]|nr:MAG: hypothetical protein A4E19_17665 [Nitrospira sp. SG-bin1]
MPQSEPVTILLANGIAEEIKLATLHFRRVFPHCRVEAVYTIEEALQWGPRAPWQLIVVDENLVPYRASPALSELKRLAPFAILVLQTDHSDSSTILDALQNGADFLLDKRSPAFHTELALYAKGAIETLAVRTTLTQTQERQDRLIDILSDGLYELDVEGRFVYLSTLAMELLGYEQNELIGTPYSAVVPLDQQDRARYHFNERRTGIRAARRIEIDLIRKASSDKTTPARVRVEISARGLYDVNRRHLGTLGLLRDISQHHRQTKTLHRLEHQLRESDRLLSIARRFSTLSQTLHVPHNAIQAQSQRLLKTIRDARLIEQVDSLASYAAEAIQLGNELVQTTAEISIHGDTVNDAIETVLATAHPPLPDTDGIERAYATDLPPFTGNFGSLVDLLRILLSHARRYMATVGSPHRVRISTRVIPPDEIPVHQATSLPPYTRGAEFEIHIQETDSMTTAETPMFRTSDDLFEAYALIKQLGGRWDFLAPAGGFLSIKVWIPVEQPPRPDSSTVPSIPLVSPEGGAVERTTEAMYPSTGHSVPLASGPSEGPTGPLPDRRRRIRMPVNIPIRIMIGDALHQGVMIDMNTSGASLEVRGVLPSFEHQPVYLLIKAAGTILELDATARNREKTPGRADIERRISHLALEFTALGENQQKILASLIETARRRAADITVEAQFPPLDRTDDLVSAFIEAGPRGTDRRETVRAQVALPVRIETSTAAARSLTGTVVNISRGGVCLQTEPFLTPPGEMVTLHCSPSDIRDRPSSPKAEPSDVILTGRIVHRTLNPSVFSGLTQPGQRIGIRFSQLAPFAEREINRVLAQHIGSIDSSDPDSRPLIVSNGWECRNRHHRTIAVTIDHARHHISPAAPIVIIIPGFGSTQTDYIPLSFYLAANGCRVLRYDHSNHIGQSEGSTLQIKLSNMQTDLQDILDFVHTTWPGTPVALLAEDIAARVAVRALTGNTSAHPLFLLNPVLNIETALSAIGRPHIVETYRQGHRRGVANLWGLNVNLDKFIGDVMAGGYADPTSSIAELAQLTPPPVILVTPRTNRPIEPVFGPQHQALHSMTTAPTIVSLPADLSGEFIPGDDRRTAAFRMIWKRISTSLIGDTPSTQVQEPNPRDVYQRQQLESEHTRIRHHVSHAARSALWGAHLAHLPQLESMPDYLSLTNELYRWLLPLELGMTVLDIGCGQRNFARVMMTNQAYRLAHQGRRPFGRLRYIGLDQSHESLRLAEQQFHAFVKELPATLAAAASAAQLVETSWMHYDWNAPLPFADGSLERILCHLSLSFAPSPLLCLRQILRVLHPEGTAVLTCFRAHTDLSSLFRRHLREMGHDGFSPPAQTVLHYLGRLHEAIRHGLLHYYGQDELARLLTHAGAGSIQLFSVLDHQLLLAIVRKTKSAG